MNVFLVLNQQRNNRKRQQPQGRLHFEKGRLYLRIHDGEPRQLFYPLSNVPEEYTSFGTKSIARKHSSGEPDFGGYIENSQNGEHTGSGMLVEFRVATDEDLRVLFTNWNHKYPLSQWVTNVYNERELSNDEKERIKRIASGFYGVAAS